MNAIEITDVRKSYKKVRALEGVSLVVGEGEFFGLLGPNGAGKEMGSPSDLITRHCERYFLIKGERRPSLNGFGVEEVEVRRGSLEEVFLKLTGKSLNVDETE